MFITSLIRCSLHYVRVRVRVIASSFYPYSGHCICIDRGGVRWWDAMACDCSAVPPLNEWRANPRIRVPATATDQRQRREIAVPSLSNGKSRKFYCTVTWIALQPNPDLFFDVAQCLTILSHVMIRRSYIDNSRRYGPTKRSANSIPEISLLRSRQIMTAKACTHQGRSW